MDVRAQLGRRVQRLRRAAGLSQEELADRADLHRTYLSGVERGLRNPTITVLHRLAQAVGVSLSELVDLDQDGRSKRSNS